MQKIKRVLKIVDWNIGVHYCGAPWNMDCQPVLPNHRLYVRLLWWVWHVDLSDFRDRGVMKRAKLTPPKPLGGVIRLRRPIVLENDESL